MHQVRSLLQIRLLSIILFLILGGFAVTLIELIFTNHTNGAQMIGIYATAFGALLTLHGLISHARSRTFLAAILLFVCAIGVVGVFEHYGTRKTKETMALMQRATDVNVQANIAAGNDSEWGARVVSPPLMAPLSLSGLSLMGMLVLLVGSDEQEDDDG